MAWLVCANWIAIGARGRRDGRASNSMFGADQLEAPSDEGAPKKCLRCMESRPTVAAEDAVRAMAHD